MRKNGFTLVELLSVIVILSLISVLDDDVIDPNTKDEFSDDMIIKISSNASTLNYEIDVDSESVENCLLILDWIHVDTDNDGVLDAGEIVSRGAEKFYIIKTPEDNDETVSLLASKCIETNPDRQTTTYFRVEFDSVTNEYENSRIKKLVKSYVTRTLGLPETQGRLITYDEAISFEAEHAEEFYGTSTKWYFWFVTPYDSNYVWVAGSDDQIKYAYYGNNYLYGIRPVIDLPLYMIK